MPLSQVMKYLLFYIPYRISNDSLNSIEFISSVYELFDNLKTKKIRGSNLTFNEIFLKLKVISVCMECHIYSPNGVNEFRILLSHKGSVALIKNNISCEVDHIIC